ncbi:D-serine deaminase, pyridoxal phosphate-dependent [Actinokineospora alba]|uniref:D-serine deaminase, pyridoxal phosphate-dependent n=1 Tax=Actinokineospora alba TaxID=504798 RepID=A0A1H0GMS5_9PSEU|nr:alanine racemase [Actinokineospora alba]TDP69960.1 D-serine deaminase-like pyridoxal phosphate-dependent protein [Actinokineospora alba]SDI05085.1 D-serine deaminase, pyridoxal phosphate-dependent [Actinokineospora alba]SDO08197.1 D-serine deaminase, pyridoxal phosphate-dependent [Actinokineospora alba]
MIASPARLDRATVDRLGEERLDWRFKSVPDALFGLTVAEAVERRPDLFDFVGPVVALDGPALDHNLATMAAWTAERGLLLAPHGKTTMAPSLFARQLDHGAWAITAATAGQLRVYRAFGVSRVVLANEFLDPAGLRWLAAELDGDPGFEFTCWVDSVRGVELMTEAWTGARPVDVLVEVGVPGGRTGARDLDTARAVAAAIVASPALRLAGVGGYEAPASADASPAGLDAVAAYLDRLRATVRELSFETEQVIVTAGGSAFFDLVADALSAPWPVPVLPVLRCGTYLTHDDGFYREISPLGDHPRVSGPPLRSALRAWAQVVSRPEPGLALLAAGKRDLPYDLGLPVPRLRRTPTGVTALTGCAVTALNDQHAFLRADAGAHLAVDVGDWVGLGLSHPCTTFDKWSLLPVTAADGRTVTGFVRTFF